MEKRKEINTHDPFLQTSVVLKQLGIGNCDFMLKLENPALEDVDPYSDHLSKEEIAQIQEECKTNPWYFLRKVVKVPIEIGDKILCNPIEGLNGAIQQFWVSLNGVNSWRRSWRQIGKSFDMSALLLWELKYGMISSIGVMGGCLTEAESNLEKIRSLEDNLPIYLRENTKVTINQIKFENATIKAVQAPKSEESIRQLLLNYDVMWYDDADLIDYLDVIIQEHEKYLKTSKINGATNKIATDIFTSAVEILPDKEVIIGDKELSESAKKVLKDAVPVTFRIFDTDSNSLKLLQKHQNTILDIVGLP